jgi:hypothetical protein
VRAAAEDFIKQMTGSVQQAPAHVSRWAERDARRKENARIAREAAQRRVERKTGVGLVERVEKAKARLNGVNVAGAIQLIQEATSTDRDYFLLAEKYGQARAGVLKQFGPGRASVETAYLAEAGLGSPDETP